MHLWKYHLNKIESKLSFSLILWGGKLISTIFTKYQKSQLEHLGRQLLIIPFKNYGNNYS